MKKKWRSCPFCGWIPNQFGQDLVENKIVETCIHPSNGCALSSLVFDEVRWNNRVSMKQSLLSFFLKKKTKTEVKKNTHTCITCRFATTQACTVFYTKFGTCYEGELWEKKRIGGHNG